MESSRESAQLKAIIVSLLLLVVGFALLSLSIILWPTGLGQFTRALAIALLTSGTLGWLGNFTLRKHFLEDVHQTVTRALSENQSGLSQLKDLGITNVFDELPRDDVRDELNNSKHNVMVLDTWIGEPEFLLKCMAKAASHNATVRILILDSESPSTKARSQDLNLGETYIADSLATNRARLLALANEHNTVQVKQYNALPSMQIFAGDNTAFIGFFWHGKPSPNGTNLRISLDSAFGEQLVQEFDELWKNASSLGGQPAKHSAE
ncbi:hypothetical protein [Nonomuraea turcica]|uniref:hypothetical protein n=1 Tax=Nonomuraea sp. G32 TaxID=3067274 RepID=UPI00273C208C|nr:hypothetical protein [Nonomuraea sp. G32]MDP4507019.1 hypothetical protein [Nonomuraea sp. G32]